MKINIQIEDASLKDLQWLFGRVSATPEGHALLPMPVLKKILEEYPPKKAEKKVPGPYLPTFEEIKREQDAEKTPRITADTSAGTILRNLFEYRMPVVNVLMKKELTPKKARGNKSNKFGIPIGLEQTDHKAYDRAWHYCNAHGITYDKIGEFKAAKKTERAAKPKKPIIKIEGADNLVDMMPDIRPPIREGTKRAQAVVAAAAKQSVPEEYKVGVHVRQIKPYLDRKVSGIGAVTALVKGLVEVNFGGRQYYKIAPDCLEVI